LDKEQVNDWNRQIIEEFRANGGKVGGPFEGVPMLLLHTTGARSGADRVSPLMCMPDGDRLVIFASKAGAPTNPDWFYNLRANPEVTVEFGTESFPARATVLDGSERDELFERNARRYPTFHEYQAKTERIIPVISLERVAN
jgi:deazaflavin-dependent oxidoreductase (nitroreductase family)